MSGGEQDAVRIRRLIGGQPEEVFDAWLDPDAIRQWMCPGDIFESIATIDARVGGRFAIVMRSPGQDDVHTGEYLEIDRPRRLSFTWRSDGTGGRETVVSLDFRRHGKGECELTLEHRGLPADRIDRHALGWRAHLRMLIDWVAAADSTSRD